MRPEAIDELVAVANVGNDDPIDRHLFVRVDLDRDEIFGQREGL